MLLDLRKITVRFGGLVALDRVDFQVEQGGIYGLIGPNGAGKSTLLNAVTGLYRPEQGKMYFLGRSIRGLKPHAIKQMGISRTFQTPGLFPHMTVQDNLLVGLHGALKGNVFSGSFRSSAVRQSERVCKEQIGEMLSYLGLQELVDRRAADLPYGHCKLLELGRALLSEPKLVLLDEPTSGLSVDESRRIVDVVQRIRGDRTITVLIIEHNIPFIQSIADRLTVLNFGVKIAEGKPEEVLTEPQVVQAYLGQ